MTLEVVQFIRSLGIDRLEKDLGVVVNRYDDRVTLNYSQVDSPKRHPVVDECRGLILSWLGLDVLSRAFDRFYNHGEDPDSKAFPMTEAVATEKIDGSLISVYHDGQRWRAATRKMAFAEGETLRGNTFHQVFERALGATVEDKFVGMDEKCTYVFEVVSSETRVVTPYKDTKCYLLTIRDKEAGDELSWEQTKDIASEEGWSVPREYAFSDLETVLGAARDLPAMEEGYVCRAYRDGKPWRLKIKNPSYLAIAHLRGNGAVSVKRMAILVVNGDAGEYLSYFPEDKPLFRPYQDAWGDAQRLVEELSVWLPMESQKEFALKVKDTPVAPLMFQIRKGQAVEDIIEKMTDNAKERLLEGMKQWQQR
jgi:hypothetical protein